MLRLVPKLIVGLAALSLFVDSADADSFKVYRKRRGFFESLFGVSNPPPRYVSNDGQLFNVQQPKRRNAFDVFGNPINYKDKKNSRVASLDIYGAPVVGNKKRVKPQIAKQPQHTEYAEPEPLPGLGMGNLDYQPSLVIPVYDGTFATRQTDSPDSEAIRLALADKTTKIRAVEAERKALLTYYSATNFKPIWTSGGKISNRALAALNILANADSEGMSAARYLPEGLGNFETIDPTLETDPIKLAAFDIALTAKVLKYARELSGGQFDPTRLSLYYDIKISPVAADGALRVIANTPFIENYLAGLAPQQPQYAMFKDALSKLKGNGNAVELMADGPRVKVEQTDPRVPAIRAKLQSLGFLSADDAVNSNEEMLDKALAAGLKKFQLANKVKQTSNIDSATIAAFNVDHSDDERQRLIINMERLRWLPKSMGNRYVFVNQPAFEVNVMDAGKSIWHSEVIVGRPLTQTYSFYDTMETVVFNPSWGVPASIIVNEYGPKSRKNPGYLDRNGFKVINAKGEVVPSSSINWWTVGQTPNFGVQQPPGSDNALGELKFLFPNSHDIYMHDTPSRNLFSESTRAFSHGCVRVHNPRDFAAVLLGWNDAKVVENLDIKDSHSVNLAQKIPVYLTYFTAWPTAEGKIMYYDDIYGRDQTMTNALNQQNGGKGSVLNDKIVQTGSIVGGIQEN
jgi:L,D-transpeptidase YcbB